MMFQSDQKSPEQSAELLRQRAVQLARVSEKEVDTADLLQVVCFRLGSETVAIPADCVLELLTLDGVTSIPSSAEHFLGITNLRGHVTAIVDLCRLLDLPRENVARHQAIVVGKEEPEFGIAVDGIDQVKMIRRSELFATATATHRELVLGVTSDGLLVFDGEQLLTCESLYIDQTD